MSKLHYTLCGLDSVWLANGFKIEETPFGETVTIADMDSLHRAIGLHIVSCDQKMSGKEFRFLRKEMDLSQKALAGLLGKNEQAINRYENGKMDIPFLVDGVVRQLYSEYVKADGELRSKMEGLADADHRCSDLEEEIERLEFAYNEAQHGWVESEVA